MRTPPERLERIIERLTLCAMELDELLDDAPADVQHVIANNLLRLNNIVESLEEIHDTTVS
jgi:hypothetical protein